MFFIQQTGTFVRVGAQPRQEESSSTNTTLNEMTVATLGSGSEMNTCVFLQINKEPFGHLKFHFFWTFFYCSSFSFVRRAFTQFARATPNFSLLNSLTLLLNRLLCFTGKKKTARILRLTQYHFHAKFRKQRDHTAPY